MTVDDFEVTITRFPEGEALEGSVTMLGSKSKEGWLRRALGCGDPLHTGMDAATSMLNDLGSMGVWTGIESIELKVRGGPTFVAKPDKHWVYKFHRKDCGNE